MNKSKNTANSTFPLFSPPLTWENLVENMGEVADNVEHFLFSQILIGHMWRVIAEKQNTLGEEVMISPAPKLNLLIKAK